MSKNPSNKKREADSKSLQDFLRSPNKIMAETFLSALFFILSFLIVVIVFLLKQLQGPSFWVALVVGLMGLAMILVLLAVFEIRRHSNFLSRALGRTTIDMQKLETEQYQSQKVLRESEQYLKKAQTIAKLVYWSMNPESGEIRLSDELRQFFSPVNRTVTNLDDFADMFHPDDRFFVLVKMTEGIETTGTWALEHRMELPDHTIRFVYSVGATIQDPDTGGRRVIGILQDITESKISQQELTVLEDRLRHSEKVEVIGQLASGIAHDFNNQLTGILGYAQLLKEFLADDPKLQKYAEKIKLGAQRSADLTGQLLKFAHKDKRLHSTVDMHDLIHEVIALLERSIDKRISVKTDLLASHHFVPGDPTELQNSLLNLAINARDAMPDGGEITFSTETVDLDNDACFEHGTFEAFPGQHLVVNVVDSGIGMDPQTQAHIFEPFFTTKGEGRGTGLGLSSVLGCVQRHHGIITLSSKERTGTKFTMYLPLNEADSIPEEATQNQTEITRDAPPACILVVDDEQTVREYTKTLLSSLGHKVITCENGEEAMELFEKGWNNIDLVILDIMMPRMSGRETLLSMRQLNPKLPAILTTGFDLSTHAVQQILDDGIQGFIQKPYLKSQLSDHVNLALSS